MKMIDIDKPSNTEILDFIRYNHLYTKYTFLVNN